MNYVMISPHFPENYKNFAISLKREGVRVLGIGSEPYQHLAPDLRSALSEYFKVDNMEDYEQMLRACAFLTFKHGKIDRIESHNEYWLEQDARLRTDFNVFGIQTETISDVRKKSRMKEIFRQAGVPVAHGAVVRTLEEARQLVDELGFPVCVKPDSGMGAAYTYKISDDDALAAFFAEKPPIDFILEEFIDGEINTFDGLTDQDGNVVFASSFQYGGVMEMVVDQIDVFFHTVRELAPDLVELGLKSVAAFNLRERFFHLEFFRTPKGELIALEINVRPPGGMAMDMFNFSNDVSLYDQYAKIVTANRFDAQIHRPYFCAFLGLRERGLAWRTRILPTILTDFGHSIVYHGPIPQVLAAAMGDYSFLIRSPRLEEVEDLAQKIMNRL